MEESKSQNLVLTPTQAAAMSPPQLAYDHRHHFHITERPMSTVRYMDKKSKSVLCNSNGIIVAEMVYRCLICKDIFETPLDCRTHFRCFHEELSLRNNKP